MRSVWPRAREGTRETSVTAYGSPVLSVFLVLSNTNDKVPPAGAPGDVAIADMPRSEEPPSSCRVVDSWEGTGEGVIIGTVVGTGVNTVVGIVVGTGVGTVVDTVVGIIVGT